MNRKLLVVVAVAAVLAALAGAAVGRNLLSSATPDNARADVVRFKDDVAKYSIAYPGSWTKLPSPANDPEVSLLVMADRSTSLLVRSSALGFENVTTKTLPIVRKFTDGLVAEDPRVQSLVDPVPSSSAGCRAIATATPTAPAPAAARTTTTSSSRTPARASSSSSSRRPRPSHLPAVTDAFQRIAATFKSEGT